jgi:hypothetical protein
MRHCLQSGVDQSTVNSWDVWVPEDLKIPVTLRRSPTTSTNSYKHSQGRGLCLVANSLRNLCLQTKRTRDSMRGKYPNSMKIFRCKAWKSINQETISRALRRLTIDRRRSRCPSSTIVVAIYKSNAIIISSNSLLSLSRQNRRRSSILSLIEAGYLLRPATSGKNWNCCLARSLASETMRLWR